MKSKKKKKKFSVTLYYHSCVQKTVEAESEDEALDTARSETTDEEVLESLVEEGSDVGEECEK